MHLNPHPALLVVLAPANLMGHSVIQSTKTSWRIEHRCSTELIRPQVIPFEKSQVSIVQKALPHARFFSSDVTALPAQAMETQETYLGRSTMYWSQ
jgi:hypothetical protein